MAHPDEGLIRAFLDREMDEAREEAFREHLETCAPCRGEVEAQELAWRRSTEALLVLDGQPDLQDARTRILTRLEQAPAGQAHRSAAAEMGRRRRARTWQSFPKAASIALILTAAGASALPGSPVRRWILDGWQALSGSGTEPVGRSGSAAESGVGPDSEPGPSAETPGSEIGASVSAEAGSMEVWVHDFPSGAALRVQWVDGNQVGVYAGEGTRFRTGEGRLEAFSPPGSVRVELPRSLARVLVGVDGEVLIRKSGSEVDISGAVGGRTPSEIVFHPRS